VTPHGSTYVALLRGVNVGRHNRISMAALRGLLAELGFYGVRTHLQSGNAVFRAARTSAQVAREVEAALAAELDSEVKVLVRSRAELAAALRANPLAQPDRDGSKLVILFLSGRPDADQLTQLTDADLGPEEFAVGRQEIYLWCPNGLHRSALVKAFGDKRLGLTTTARNQKTVVKLVELAEAADTDA
jgi:uncharacterized protein (DUF1697 family)